MSLYQTWSHNVYLKSRSDQLGMFIAPYFLFLIV